MTPGADADRLGIRAVARVPTLLADQLAVHLEHRCSAQVAELRFRADVLALGPPWGRLVACRGTPVVLGRLVAHVDGEPMP